ncbi:hypothetical protein MASR1M12_37440 [Erysipelotrichia bacterium]
MRSDTFLNQADDAAIHHVGVDDELGIGADAGTTGLQQIRKIVFDGELNVEIVFQLVFEGVL